MILYHGTNASFSRFHPFSFFTDDFTIAEHYARSRHMTVLQHRRGRVLMVHVPDDTPLIEVTPEDLQAAGIACSGYDADYNDWEAIDYHQTKVLSGAFKMTRLRGLKDMCPNWWDNDGQEMRTYDQFMVKDPRIITMLGEVVLDDNAESTQELLT